MASPTIESLTFSGALRRLYFIRFAFAVAWALVLFGSGGEKGALLTVLVVVYSLFDAAAVLWQMRADPDASRSKASEWINVVVSVAVAIALGVASSNSIGAALTVWGAWAIGAGIPQLITAIRNRRSGGQVPQMLSGGISVLAGAGFLGQGLNDPTDMTGVGGYTLVGALFFLISAIRLNVVLKKSAA